MVLWLAYFTQGFYFSKTHPVSTTEPMLGMNQIEEPESDGRTQQLPFSEVRNLPMPLKQQLRKTRRKCAFLLSVLKRKIRRLIPTVCVSVSILIPSLALRLESQVLSTQGQVKQHVKQTRYSVLLSQGLT